MSNITVTIPGQKEITITHEDAVKYIIDFLRKPRQHSYGHYGYDLYLHTMLSIYCEEKLGFDPYSNGEIFDNLRTDASTLFMDACWELCRRGILRPFPRDVYGQGTSQGAGFSVTAFGKRWVQEAEFDDYVPTEPERFAELLAPYRDHFGAGFYERAQQAVRCYGAHAYLACCAMCGAAAESVMLATAIAKSGDEEQVMKIYATSNGRMRIENQVIGQAAEHLKREFRGLTELINYWRDEAAHGRTSGISDNEAYTSLAMMLRYTMFIHKYWHDLLMPVLRQDRPPTVPQAIVLQGQQVLLVKRDNPRFWELPGGGMVPGETPEATVVREVQEETGVQVEIIELLGWYERTGFRAHLSPVYVCRPQSGPPQAQDTDTVQVRYFPLHRLPRGLCPWYRSILQHDLLSPHPRPLRHTQHLGLQTVLHCIGLDLVSRLGLLR